ncbi:MAG TPA: 2-oxoglutarate dehydrogenase complex dihydrolipoyllysine-residue succinyltransferase [Candidatus Latescibacteria bacterium]|nr:2-oxoglutarate dehydrogenase complex dihydrolipoyllysine-residue succinyltransferase [Candidatus Handelsmanbacteria bacterium]HIL09291.1 2-oxoglutarate dehydrogenase complex dihydrolipoyllysine-residue succinyltransferase [Candidatus Latescibacterota bacterium]
MAVDVAIPGMGESVSEVILIEWLKSDGQYVERDEPICVLETDKANVDLPSPAGGVLQHLQALETTLEVGAVIARIEEGAAPAVEVAEEAPAAAPAKSTEDAPAAQADAKEASTALSPAVRRLVEEHALDPVAIVGTGKDGRLTKKDVQGHLHGLKAAAKEAPVAEPAAPAQEIPVPASPTPARQALKPIESDEEGIRREPMSRIRQRIAQHLVGAQHNAAMLTTFNEVDLSGVMQLRAKYKERFAEVHGVSLGLMSFFSRAVVLALGEYPAVNAQIDGTDIVYHDFVNLGIAVSTDRGLLVPILRRAEQLSMADVEGEIKRLALGARDNKLAMDELSGGTFTITNGGVFGSLLSTPILNAPQSGILGMHAIKDRPIAVDGEVVIRPMMYVALSYDHRLVDGQQSVSFLVRVKELVEDPTRLMLQV